MQMKSVIFTRTAQSFSPVSWSKLLQRARVNAAKPCVLNTPALQQLPKKRMCSLEESAWIVPILSWIRIHKRHARHCKSTLFAAFAIFYSHIPFPNCRYEGWTKSYSDIIHYMHMSLVCCSRTHIGYCVLPSRLATDLAQLILAMSTLAPLKGLMLIKSGVVSIMTLGQNLRTRCPNIGLAIFGDTLVIPWTGRMPPRNRFEGYQGILKWFHNPAGDWNPGWGGRSNGIDQHPPHLNWAVHRSDAKYWLKLKHPVVKRLRGCQPRVMFTMM